MNAPQIAKRVVSKLTTDESNVLRLRTGRGQFDDTEYYIGINGRPYRTIVATKSVKPSNTATLRIRIQDAIATDDVSYDLLKLSQVDSAVQNTAIRQRRNAAKRSR